MGLLSLLFELKSRSYDKGIFKNITMVIFQSILFGNIFKIIIFLLFLKNYFLYQHIKTIQK